MKSRICLVVVVLAVLALAGQWSFDSALGQQGGGFGGGRGGFGGGSGGGGFGFAGVRGRECRVRFRPSKQHAHSTFGDRLDAGQAGDFANG